MTSAISALARRSLQSHGLCLGAPANQQPRQDRDAGKLRLRVVERVPLKVGLNPLNEKYLDTKAKKSGHIL
jgi:hypothetical protein